MSDLEKAIGKVLDDPDQKAMEIGPMFA